MALWGDQFSPKSSQWQLYSKGMLIWIKKILYIDVIMTTMASQITSLVVVYSIVYSGADQRNHQSSASLAFVRWIHREREFPAQRASNAENVPIWWRHRVNCECCLLIRLYIMRALQWRQHGHDGVSNHQRLDCLLNRLFKRKSKKTPKLRITGLCEGNPPVTGGFPPQRASNVSIWWRHHVIKT